MSDGRISERCIDHIQGLPGEPVLIQAYSWTISDFPEFSFSLLQHCFLKVTFLLLVNIGTPEIKDREGEDTCLTKRNSSFIIG